MAAKVDLRTEFAVTQLPAVQAVLEASGVRKSALSTVATGYFLGAVFGNKQGTGSTRNFPLSPDEWRTVTKVLAACPPASYVNHPQVAATAAVFTEAEPQAALTKLLTIHLPLGVQQGGWHDYWPSGEMIDHQLKRKVDSVKAQCPALDQALVDTVSQALRNISY